MKKIKIIVSLLLCFTCIFCFSFSTLATSGNDIFENETEDYNEAQSERNSQIKKLIINQLENVHEAYLIQNEISNENNEADLLSLNDTTREEYILELEASNERLYQKIIDLGGNELSYNEFEDLYYSNGIRPRVSDESLNIMYTELRKTHYAYMLDYNITLGKNECNPGTTYQVKQICIVPSKDGIYSIAGNKYLTHTGINNWQSNESINLSKIAEMGVDKLIDYAKDTIVENVGKFSIAFKFLDIMKELENYANKNVKTTSGRISTIRTEISTVESMSYVFVKVRGVWQPILSSNMIIATDEIYVSFPIGDTKKMVQVII